MSDNRRASACHETSPVGSSACRLSFARNAERKVRLLTLVIRIIAHAVHGARLALSFPVVILLVPVWLVGFLEYLAVIGSDYLGQEVVRTRACGQRLRRMHTHDLYVSTWLGRKEGIAGGVRGLV